MPLALRSDGAIGIHGKPFDATAGSRVYGLALVASAGTDRQDIIFCRHYFEQEKQIVKPANENVVVSMNIGV